MSEEDVFEFSASAITKWRQCNRAYGYTYVLGQRAPAGAGAALGTAIHKELETWLLQKTVPENKFARSLTALGPHPDHPNLHIEKPLRLLFPVGAARGFIDIFIPEPDPKFLPKGWKWSPDIPSVHDWKSTASIDKYALTEDELLGNVQGILYGIEARAFVAKTRKVKLTDIPEVDLSWNYSSTKGKRHEKAVRVRQTLAHVDEHLPGILSDAEAMRAAKFAGPESLNDLDGNLDQCDAFGGCPHKDSCTAYAARKPFDPISALGGHTDPVAIRNDLVTIGSQETKRMSSTLDRLKNLKKKPMGAEKEATPAAAATTAPTPAPAQVVTPEPELQAFDTSGLDTKPPAPVKLNPPDAVPNLTPETAPTAEDPTVGPKRGRPAKPKAKPEMTIVDAAPLVEAEAHPARPSPEFLAEMAQSLARKKEAQALVPTIKRLAAEALEAEDMSQLNRFVDAFKALRTL